MSANYWSHIRLRQIGIVLMIALAGCSAPGIGSDVATPTQSSGSAGTETGAVADENKEVELLNEWNQSVELHLRIVRLATNETVHDQRYTLQPESRRTGYTIRRSDTDGIESFEVIVTARNTTARDTFSNDACYGDIRIPINPDGTFDGPLSGGIC